MKARRAAVLALVALMSSNTLAQTPPAARTPAGIALDAPWKQAVFAFANEKLQHSAWGVSHSERDFLVGTQLAKELKLEIDGDVLFAAAFLHDVGAFEAWRKDGVDHTDRAAEVVPEILASAGFPAAKLAAVQEAVRNHMYYSQGAMRPEAIVLRDADTVDFLGAIGVARIVSLTTRHRWATDLDTALKTLDGFAKDLPGRVSTNAGRKIANERAAEMTALLATLRTELQPR